MDKKEQLQRINHFLIVSLLLLLVLPVTGFTFIIHSSTINHQSEKIDALKDEICRLNKIIETLKENKRACYIPPIDRPNLT